MFYGIGQDSAEIWSRIGHRQFGIQHRNLKRSVCHVPGAFTLNPWNSKWVSYDWRNVIWNYRSIGTRTAIGRIWPACVRLCSAMWWWWIQPEDFDVCLVLCLFLCRGEEMIFEGAFYSGTKKEDASLLLTSVPPPRSFWRPQKTHYLQVYCLFHFLSPFYPSFPFRLMMSYGTLDRDVHNSPMSIKDSSVLLSQYNDIWTAKWCDAHTSSKTSE